MAEFLFEIFCEEIPARMQARAGEDLEKALIDGLSKAGLEVKGAHSWAGPRRLGFTADIPLKSPDVSEERKGPRVGSPEQALAGFLRGAGLSDISEAQIRSDKKGDHYVAVLEKPGQDSSEIISALIPDVMNNFPWPKSMKSGGSTFRWVRPLQSMICLLDGQIIPVEAGGIIASNATEGHRRHGRGPFTVDSYAAYKKVLEEQGHVLLSMEDRKAKILKDAVAACEAAGLALVEDEGLLAEVAGLAEWPVVILGDMEPAFLELPGEVIRLSMRTHQKYFAVKNKDGSLAPNFIVVANQAAPDGGKAIAAGNSRVLSARLDDARFFQSEDAKKKLIDYYDKLDTVVFHKKLGSIKDKAERVTALARGLARDVGADPDKAALAAKLSKCDLVTQTVIEFTSLQGQIGRLMYEREGGYADIAVAIEDHYKPQGPSDDVPTNPVAVAVALADKLDTLVGFWAIGEKPTGSKDPFALRRAALGVVRIILENGVRLSLLNSIAQILYTTLIFGFRTTAGENERRNFYKNLAKSIDPQFDDVEEYPDWSVRPFNLYTNGDGLILDYADDISAAIIGFPWIYGEDISADEVEEQQLGYAKLQELRERLIVLDTYANELEAVQMFGGLNTLGQKLPSIFQVRKNDHSLVFDAAKDVYFELYPFIRDRLKVYLRDKGIRHDLIDAVFAGGGDDLVAIVNRVEALQAFLSTEDGANLLAGYKRAANILKAEEKKGALPDGTPGAGTQAEETALFNALQAAQPRIEAALSSEDYAGAMSALAALRGPIDAFFDNVMVVSEIDGERQNRLRLLSAIRDTASQIADFDKIDG